MKPPKLIEKMKQIMNAEGLTDWKLEIDNAGGGLCLQGSKTIYLDKSNLNIPFLLHEMAHATTKQGHTGRFADTFTELVIKYMKPL